MTTIALKRPGYRQVKTSRGMLIADLGGQVFGLYVPDWQQRNRLACAYGWAGGDFYVDACTDRSPRMGTYYRSRRPVTRARFWALAVKHGIVRLARRALPGLPCHPARRGRARHGLCLLTRHASGAARPRRRANPCGVGADRRRPAAGA